MSENRQTGTHYIRLDLLLTERGLVPTRTKAQTAIRSGAVFSKAVCLDKPGQLVPPDLVIEIRGNPTCYVSRAGQKLDYALSQFSITPGGLICLDVGASTGGFSGVLLGRGARRVYAIDVGHDQLDPSIRADPRVVVMEGLNVKALTQTLIADPVELITCDISFISLRKALPAALALAAPGAFLVALIKPQFEVGRAAIGKGGIVRDSAAQQVACTSLARWLDTEMNWKVLGLIESPITGKDGNKEFLIGAQRNL